ncbi:hypothetical protein [Kitasatospora viridis]|uniref:Uncharacterized protein n=1 Tax=Kitasatospora viridis TaxID=281105 RepID=A0A561T701_9ACTN|nr:hypothetical protein [Kitasatospora viridis]TWF82879.1 hypothetical protein FHX73_14361 [Kitasatospora viridis]
MAPACPQCATSYHAVPVPQIHADASIPSQARAVLAPPPPEPQAPPQQSTGASVLFVFAGLAAGAALFSLTAGKAAPIGLPAILVAIGVAVRSRSRDRARQAAEQAGYEQQTRHQGLLRVWQAGWLCRGCGVAFFPAGAVGPDSAASPAIEPAEYQARVIAAVDGGHPPDQSPWSAELPPTTAACPQCAGTDHALPIPRALADTVQPVGVSASVLLAEPVAAKPTRRGPAEDPAALAARKRIWQAGWLCRTCLVAFYPAGSLAAGSPASPAIPVQRFQEWVTSTAAAGAVVQGPS